MTCDHTVKASEFDPHPDGRRFHSRTYNGGLWQVYGFGLIHVCECQTEAMADMVRDSLALAGEAITCDHTAKPLALAPVHGIQNRAPTEGILGKSMVFTGTWKIRDWLILECAVCGKTGLSLADAVKVSFAGRIYVRWDVDNKYWRWREIEKQ